ncbi:MAG: DASH family cryptochrome [Thermaurantimonas sp.]
MKTIALVWYRWNLRTRDCAPLEAASRSGLPVVPFYCFDDRYHGTLYTGWPRTGMHRTRFLLESLNDLRRSLLAAGSDLYCKKGLTEDIIREIHSKFSIAAIYYPKYYSQDEIEIEYNVSKLNIPMIGFDEHSLIDPDDLPIDVAQLPYVFTEFRKKVEKSLKIKTERPWIRDLTTPSEFIEASSIPDIDSFGFPTQSDTNPKAAFALQGGETNAWKRVEYYIWNSRKISTYKQTRNGLIGEDYSSKFSPYLAMGNISARSIYWQIKAYEQEIESNESTYWLFFELLWRDFFIFNAMKMNESFFKVARHYKPKITKSFEKWRLGETNEPFVNANMIELLKTGYMSNRGRQVVASYLVHNLKQPWYAGALWFESQLIDYDVYSNYGNWTYVAGIGNDPRNRVFNVKRQAEMYDPDGSYQRHWLGT